MKKNKVINVLIIVLTTILISSCANVTEVAGCVTEDPYGFWSGVWHGWISPITFISGIFHEDIAMYAVNNTGSWYDFGFLLGVGCLSGGSATIRRSR